VDQKMNDGIPVPFFGRDVMTAPALAELALRYDCPVVPARITRLKGARFRLMALAPLELIRTGDHKADVAANMAQVNALIEQWVRDTPEQWLWLHNRWPGG
ncbi:MAG: lauroyl acyltransferase, partial [Rhodospirillales bacterium]|nr:lauroyl acyltransferase [Rhodospirillales bacterium]